MWRSMLRCSNVGARFAIASHSAIRAEHSVTARALLVDMETEPYAPDYTRACMALAILAVTLENLRDWTASGIRFMATDAEIGDDMARGGST